MLDVGGVWVVGQANERRIIWIGKFFFSPEYAIFRKNGLVL
jgi:hypothetical protein